MLVRQCLFYLHVISVYPSCSYTDAHTRQYTEHMQLPTLFVGLLMTSLILKPTF